MRKLPYILCALFLLLLQGASAQEFNNQVSSPDISSFEMDPRGYVWMGTRHGLNRYDGSIFMQWKASEAEGSLLNDEIADICTDNRGNLWVATLCGVQCYSEGSFHRSELAYREPSYRVMELDAEHMLISNRHGLLKVRKSDYEGIALYSAPGMDDVRVLSVVPGGDIWAACHLDGENRVMLLDSDLQKTGSIPVGKEGRIQVIAPAPDGSVWVSASSGLFLFDNATCRPLDVPEDLARLTRKGKMHFAHPYLSQSMVFGIQGQGIFSYNPYTHSLSRLHPEYVLEGDEYVCWPDSQGNLWLSDGVSGPVFLPVQTYALHYSLPVEGFLNTITFDREGYLWFASELSAGSYDLRTLRVVYTMPEGCPEGCLAVDAEKGQLWKRADHNKLDLYRIAGGKAQRIRRFTFDNNIISVSPGSDGLVWVIQEDRVSYISTGLEVTHFQPSPGDPRFMLGSLRDDGTGDDFVFSISQSEPHVRLLRPDGPVEMDDRNFLALTDVHTGKDNVRWVGTLFEGLARVQLPDGAAMTYTSRDGLVENTVQAIEEDGQGNIWFSTPSHIVKYDKQSGAFQTVYDNQLFYAAGCSAVSPSGDVYFGGGKGITGIRSGQQIPFQGDIPLHFNRIQVNGRNVSAAEVNLSPSDKLLHFFFSGTDFISGSRLNYAYKMEGYQKDWVETTVMQAIYTNLPPGKYTFRVRVRLNNGAWSKGDISVPVTVRPPFWKSARAKVLYALLGLVLLGGALYLFVRWRLVRERLELARRKEEMNREHIDFITNVSHEYRTPLSLIYAPARQLMQSSTLSEQDKHLVRLVAANAEKMRSLTDIVLNVHKGVEESVKLHVRPMNLSAFAAAAVSDFEYVAKERGLELSSSVAPDVEGFSDPEILRTILYNLLSNAMKYTPEGGKVSLSLTGDGDKVCFVVSDSGPGIPEEKRKDLFKRYNRLGADGTVPGSGIGLNYSMAIARLHKGEIKYVPNIPEGSVFSFTVPVSRASYADMDIAEAYGEAPDVRTSPAKGKILVVEDNDDVRLYLRDLLQADYDVELCGNGMEALDRISLSVPDLVLSDVMMPFKNGLELCRDIKASADYAHLPVILLTGKADGAVEGMQCGADAFVPKPFDPVYLVSVVESLLKNRRILQEKVRSLTSATAPAASSESGLSPQEEKFLARVHRALDEHLSEDALSVELLGREVGASHSSLYAKIKSLTGESPQAYITTYRMNRAMEMLRSGQYTVTEVAYSVGASSVSNFSRDFKRQFSVTPSSVLQEPISK